MTQQQEDQNIVEICTTYRLPDTEDTFRLSTELNPDNIPMNHITSSTDPFTLAVLRGRMWQTGQEIKVKFMSPYPSATLRQKIIDAFKQWEQFANIKLTVVPDTTTTGTQIRIKVTSSGSSSSYIGTDNAGIAQDRHTMEFGWLKDTSSASEINRVVVHEFGHALGCIHEHQSPAANIPWDKEAVYAHYAKQGWSRATVDHNIFRTYEKSSTNYSEFDKLSIMIYSIPDSLTIGTYSVGWNTQLSAVDKSHIGIVYPMVPKPIPDLGTSLSMDKEILTNIAFAGEVDKYSFTLPANQRVMIETMGNTDVIMSLLDVNGNVLAYDDDSGEGRNARIQYNAVANTAYTVKIKHYSVSGTGSYRIKMTKVV